MERVACLALFLCWLSLAAGQCCVKDVNYCPASTNLPPAEPRSCTSFGTGHIHTFDGLSYDFHEYGDFYLLADDANPATSFSVQVRQSDCSSGNTLAVPVDRSTSFQGTCNRAFLFSNAGNRVEFRHDLNAESLTILLNGNPQTATTTIQSYGIVANVITVPMAYVSPTTNISRAPGPDADFFVQGTFTTVAITFSLWFYSNGFSTIHLLRQGGAPTGGVRYGGLCGFVDGCVANDLALRFNPPLNAPSPAPAASLATVFSDNSQDVIAGTLPLNRQFINDTKDPAKWAPAFGASWRVGPAEPSFQSSDSPNIRWTTSDYSQTGGTDCIFAKGWSVPTFLVNQCSLDKKYQPETTGGFSYAGLSSYHLLMTYCSYFCVNGKFPFRNPALLPNHCDGFCQYPQGDTTGTPDITTVYGQAPLWTAPPAWFQQQNTPTALYTPQLTVAGEYVFNLKSSDFCESRFFNVTRSITCTNTVSVPPATLMPRVQRISSYAGVFPRVQILVQEPESVVRVQYKFVEYPGALPAFRTVYNDAGNKGFAPQFQPDVAGKYVIQYSVYDGCSIVYQNITIIASCSNCPQASIIATTNIKDFIFGTAFNAPLGGPSLIASNTYQTKTLVAGAVSGPATYNYRWSIINDDNSLDFISSPDNANFYVNRYPNDTVAQFAMMNPNGTVLNNTMFTSSDPPVISPPFVINNPILAALKGPTNSQYGVFPVQREFLITRPGASTTQTTTSMVTRWWNATWMQFATSTPVCQLTLGAPTGATSVIGLNPLPNNIGTFNYASPCVGQYNLLLNVSEPTCAWSRDVQKLDVDCGPAPDVFVSCFAQSQYNYATRLFPTVTVDASRSFDPYGRFLIYRYSYQTVPMNSTTPVTNFGNFAQLIPDRPGTYDVLAEVSNGCNSQSQVSSFNAYCTGSASEVTAAFTSGPATVSYDGTPASKVITLTDASSTTNTAAFLTSAWSFVSIPPTPLFFFPPSFSNPTAASPLLTLTYAGSFTILDRVSQGCFQYSEQTATITLVCDAILAPSIVAPTTVIPWVQNVGWTSATYTGAPTVTWGAAPPAAAGAAVLSEFWTDTPTYPNTSQFFGNVYTPTVPFPMRGGSNIMLTYYITDDCKIASAPALTVQYQCYNAVAQLSINAVAAPTIQVSGTASNLGYTTGLFATWVVVPPQGVTAPVVNPTGFLTGTFVAFSPGVYTVYMSVDDGCVNATTSAIYTAPACQQLVPTPVAMPTTTSTWTQNGFPKIELNGNQSLTNNRLPTAFSYQWIVYEAPAFSIFSHMTTMASTLVNSTSTSSVFTGGYRLDLTNVSYTETNTTTVSLTRLANSNNLNANTYFPSCIYPDIAGTYVLGLSASDGCQTVVTNITVMATCPAAPVIVFNVTENANYSNTTDGPRYVSQGADNTWTVSLSRSVPRRVVLDARNSTNSSQSKLTYYWAWNYNDSRAGTLQAQDAIETPYASTSALVLSAAGNYSLTLTVHDGCSYSFLNFTIIAMCADPAASFSPSSVTTDGKTYPTIRLYGSDTSCSTNAWTVLNFTVRDGFSNSGIGSAATSVVPSMFVFGLFLTATLASLL